MPLCLQSCKNTKENKQAVKKEVVDPADEVIKNIVVPEFPDKTFAITDFGAVGDGTTLNTDAFKEAIAACHEAGGGKVVVPSGKFLTGPIHLKSNVNLHTEEGAVVLFSTNTEDYLPVVHTSYEGVELMNYSPLIYAYRQKNIAVTGKGVFNGQAGNSNWWPWCGSKDYGYVEGAPHQRNEQNLPRLRKMNDEGTPVEERVFGKGHHLRPTFFEPFECENVWVQGVTFTNAPFWVMHPIKSNSVTVDGVTVKSHGPNNDGCDPEYAKNVHIKNCVFDTGDDCIAIKSGRNNDGRRVNIPSENIVVEDCDMKDGHGGVVMGSEISAGVRNVYVRNCTMDSPNLDRAIRIKTNTLRGGFVENVYVNNIQVGQVKEAVLKINTHYAIYEDQEGEYMPAIKNIHLKDVTVKNSGKYGILIRGREASKVRNVSFENVSISGAKTAMSVENSEPVKFINTTINGKKYDTE
ncbi:glycoside hydrolase family 28 protein [Sinomicrobium kalidii]|uniref:glycoside hydrolase family 28 protein n=1 Tax=Sinomicrobium kalidii TaxID=2900738 RepID=UPI001E623597|nr:glycoside hydrolase family 28 protein [Sinomicrobium kalidii]UGU14406.1 glycoside hydrolase family 28 protein [Sinomicrobium kalidii]